MMEGNERDGPTGEGRGNYGLVPSRASAAVLSATVQIGRRWGFQPRGTERGEASDASFEARSRHWHAVVRALNLLLGCWAAGLQGLTGKPHQNQGLFVEASREFRISESPEGTGADRNFRHVRRPRPAASVVAFYGRSRTVGPDALGYTLYRTPHKPHQPPRDRLLLVAGLCAAPCDAIKVSLRRLGT